MSQPPVEPPADRDKSKLDPEFAKRLSLMEEDLRYHGLEPILIEGYRSKERQVWLWCSGRNRPGPIVTKQDGVQRRSRHQDGCAADYWFKDKQGRTYCPHPRASEWRALAGAADRAGLISGSRWIRLPDPDHVELPATPAKEE